MRLKFIFFIFIFLIPVITAGGFSPSSLTYLIEQNKELCQIVNLDSISQTIIISDSWAENKDVDWRVSLFNMTAEEHGLILSYPFELLSEDKEAEICIIGSELGEFHGVAIFRQGQQGNSIIQYGVWLKVVIEEKPQQPSPEQSQQQNGGSSGGGGGGGGSGKVNLQVEAKKDSDSVSTGSPLKNDLADNEIKQLSGENQKVDANPSITGNAINENSGSVHYIIPIVFVIIAVLGFFHFRNKRKRAFGYQFITP